MSGKNAESKCKKRGIKIPCDASDFERFSAFCRAKRVPLELGLSFVLDSAFAHMGRDVFTGLVKTHGDRDDT